MQLIIGITGAAIILIAFVLNQLNILKNNDLSYDVLNFVGSLLLIIYALEPLSLPFVILNGVWAGVSFKDVVLKIFKKK